VSPCSVATSKEDFERALKGRATVLGLPVDNALLNPEFRATEVLPEASHRIHGWVDHDGAHLW
jgi:hypothetical protein